MKRSLPFVMLQTSNIASGVGNGIVMIAVPWLVLDLTGSPAAAGLLGALVMLPGIVVSPFIGTMIDRIGRRKVSIYADVLSAVSVLLFVLVDRVGELTYIWVVLLAVLGAVFDPAGHTARKALIPNAAAASSISLETANSRHEGLFAVGWAIGPAIGAALIKLVGPVDAMLATSFLFFVASISVMLMRIVDSASETRDQNMPHENFWQATVAGFRALHADRALFSLTIIFMFTSAVYMPIEMVILPVHFERLGDAGGLGATMTALASGMVLGAFSFGAIARRFSRFAILGGVMIGVAFAVMPMVWLPPTFVFVIAGFLMGAIWGPFNPLWNTLIQSRVPTEMQGRVYGVQMSALYAAPPIGQVVVGLAVESFGLQQTFAVCAALFIAVALLTLSLPALRDLSHTPLRQATIHQT
ncbi:MAG: MFS transporter [Actinobacteria bacterium]|nr:MFS transporter [Actinomycetota bacterium]